MKDKKDDFVFGVHAVNEAIHSDQEIERIMVTTIGVNETLKKIVEEARSLNIPVQKVPPEKFNKITRKNHQGVVAYISPIKYSSLDSVLEEVWGRGEDPFFIVLDRVNDVRNFGAIARTAECAGIHGIIIPGKGSARISSDAVKTSSGALHHLPIVRVKSLESTVVYLKESGIRLVACTEKTEANLFEVDMKGPLAIIMGNEETGIAHDILKHSDDKAKIPLNGKIESLNVSVAAGVIVYEAVRQRF